MSRWLVCALSLLMLDGCTRCLGVLECEGDAHRSISGQVLELGSGKPVPAVIVDFVVARGEQRDSTRVLTSDRGIFEADLSADAAWDASDVMLRFTRPDGGGYEIHDLPCPVTKVHGDGCVIAPVLSTPVVSTLYFFRYRGAEGVGVGEVPVSFTRTSGSFVVSQESPQTFSMQTDVAGNATIFNAQLPVTGLQPVVGDLTVTLPAPFGASIVHGFSVRPVYRAPNADIEVVTVGPNFAYRLQFTDSLTAQGISGVEVRFFRTSGVPLVSDSLSGVSDSSGNVLLAVRPLGAGTIVGDLEIRAPRATSSVRRSSITLPTFDADSSRLAARYRVGATGSLYLTIGP